jgi:hypothetical protein
LTLQLKESSDQLSLRESLAGQSMRDFRISAAPKHYPSAPIEGQDLAVLRLRGGGGESVNDDSSTCSSDTCDSSYSFVNEPIVIGDMLRLIFSYGFFFFFSSFLLF